MSAPAFTTFGGFVTATGTASAASSAPAPAATLAPQPIFAGQTICFFEGQKKDSFKQPLADLKKLVTDNGGIVSDTIDSVCNIAVLTSAAVKSQHMQLKKREQSMNTMGILLRRLDQDLQLTMVEEGWLDECVRLQKLDTSFRVPNWQRNGAPLLMRQQEDGQWMTDDLSGSYTSWGRPNNTARLNCLLSGVKCCVLRSPLFTKSIRITQERLIGLGAAIVFEPKDADLLVIPAGLDKKILDPLMERQELTLVHEDWINRCSANVFAPLSASERAGAVLADDSPSVVTAKAREAIVLEERAKQEAAMKVRIEQIHQDYAIRRAAQEKEAEQRQKEQEAKKRKADEEAEEAEARRKQARIAAGKGDVPDENIWRGQKFLLMGGFTNKFKIEQAITSLGGELTDSVLKSLSFVVCGRTVDTGYGNVSGPGSKKYKEAKKMKRVVFYDEQSFHEAHKKIVEESGEGGDDTEQRMKEARNDPVLTDWQAIKAKVLLEPTDLKPATVDEIKKCEETVGVKLPAFLLALLQESNGSNSISTGLDYSLPFLWPSTSEMIEQHGYNSYNATILKDMHWLPWHMLDYDFCWEGLDLDSGSVAQVDMECRTYSVFISPQAFIKSYRAFLNKPKGSEESEDGVAPAAAASASSESTASKSTGEIPADETPAACKSRLRALLPDSGKMIRAKRSMGLDMRNRYHAAYKRAEMKERGRR